jgi:hypothetical protein
MRVLHLKPNSKKAQRAIDRAGTNMWLVDRETLKHYILLPNTRKEKYKMRVKKTGPFDITEV